MVFYTIEGQKKSFSGDSILEVKYLETTKLFILQKKRRKGEV